MHFVETAYIDGHEKLNQAFRLNQEQGMAAQEEAAKA
jgi:hypothetical protein